MADYIVPMTCSWIEISTSYYIFKNYFHLLNCFYIYIYHEYLSSILIKKFNIAAYIDVDWSVKIVCDLIPQTMFNSVNTIILTWSIRKRKQRQKSSPVTFPIIVAYIPNVSISIKYNWKYYYLEMYHILYNNIFSYWLTNNW